MTAPTSSDTATTAGEGGHPRPARWRTSAGRSELGRAVLARPVRSLLVIYAVSRVVAVLAIWIAAHYYQSPAGVGHLHPGLADMFRLWDTEWYRRIVTDGYPIPLPSDPETGQITYSAWAFFPLFPALVRLLMLTGLGFTASAVLLNLALGAAATLLVWKVLSFPGHAASQPARERLAFVAAALWCFYPATGVMVLPYTEALAAALIAGSLLMLMRGRYLTVAVLVLLLGFTRAAAAPLGLAVLAHLWLRWREERGSGTAPFAHDRLRIVVMCLATAVSGVAWPVAVGYLSGLPDAFFQVQAAWGQRPDEGPFVLWFNWAWEQRGLFSVIVMVALVGTYLALVIGRHGAWIPIEVRMWALVYPLYLFAVVRPITSMWRFLLLDFPLMALLASVTMRTSTGGRVVRHWRRRAAVVVLLLALGVVAWSCGLLPYVPWHVTPP
ncbi:hypothetical protein ASG73_13580 [Janibacter sp. Soil728]|uniref:hypothetical protein n=1 Tax=Janibacter sp. Soil728 TaxID=1736393 RepID=UPI0006F7A527|nr:hypothetical protein [Janibacter sp. Soil728]KRE35735.1 hypothetical protein ASG73_13580 [Janibacter sp. Soil728]